MKNKPAHRYKEKQCPICGVLHKKRYQCCSVKCGTAFKLQTPPTEEAIRARAEGVRRWKYTDRGEATNTNLKQYMNDDELVLPPGDIEDGYFIEDGDVWTSD